MTKKHFEAFAREIKKQVDAANDTHTISMSAKLRQSAMYAAELVANVAASDNPRFNRDRFMKACGL